MRARLLADFLFRIFGSRKMKWIDRYLGECFSEFKLENVGNKVRDGALLQSQERKRRMN